MRSSMYGQSAELDAQLDISNRHAQRQLDAMLDVVCIKCSARPGDGCRSANDKPLRPHAARWLECDLSKTERRSELTK